MGGKENVKVGRCMEVAMMVDWSKSSRVWKEDAIRSFPAACSGRRRLGARIDRKRT